jgi:exodeoxyribonuclease VII small subunit
MPAKKKASPPPAADSFEEAADELEAIIKILEQEPSSLAKLLDDFERGQDLLSYCQNTLKSARKRLDIVEAKLQANSLDNESNDSSQDDEPPNDDDVRLL